MKALPVICTLFLLVSCQGTFSQTEAGRLSRPFKNVFYLNIGPFYPQAALEYERDLFSGKKHLASYSAGLSVGGLKLSSSGGPYTLLKGIALIGREKHHLELTAGAMLFFDWEGFDYEVGNRMSSGVSGPVIWTDYLVLIPNFTLGYRFQKPGGKLMFRAGTGYPVSFAYIGCGIAF